MENIMSKADEKMMDMQRMFLEKNAIEMDIPDYMIESLVQYILIGRPVGHFLTAIINNDLKGAVNRGDDMNQCRIVNYVKFLFNYAPHGSWGYEGSTNMWIARGGKYPQHQPVTE